MKRMHVHVSVADIGKAIGFYSALFAPKPAVVKTDYAKWMLDDPRVNFAISTRGRATRPRSPRHPGRERRANCRRSMRGCEQAGGAIVEEGQTTCCYAKSEKSWIDDPAGISGKRSTPPAKHDYGAASGERADRAREACCGAPARRAERSPRRLRGVRPWPIARSTCCFSAPAIRRARSWPRPSSTSSAAGKFRAFTAGSHPKGQVNPHTVALLQSLGYDTSGFRSKSWSEFARPGAPALDFVFTVCDNAAGEACPVWPGQPMTAHWGVPDPAEATGTPAEIALAFKDAYRMLHQRIAIFTALPIRSPRPAHSARAGSGRSDTWQARPARSQTDVRPRLPTACRRGARHRVPARRRGRLGHHGGEARGRKRRARAALQHAADRRDPRGADPDRSARCRARISIRRSAWRCAAPRIAGADAAAYVAAQVAGGIVGVLAAHVMFELPLWQFSATVRTRSGAVARGIRRHLRPAADDLRLRCADARGRSPTRSASTSRRPTGSRRRRRSPIPR